MGEESDPLAEAEDLMARGKPREAAFLLDDLHARGRGGLLLQTARVRAWIAAGEPDRALAAAREVASLHPNIAFAAFSLGTALLAAGHLAAAIGEFQRTLRLDPDLVDARMALGCAWLEAGEADKAEDAFNAIPAAAAPPALAARRAEIMSMRARTRSDPRYVRHLFDEFSSDYDTRMLGQLGYSAPAILRNLADLLGLAQHGNLNVLDLGCGTGLAGAAFRDIATSLDGIDLSPAMVEKARARGIYDTLCLGDIETAPALFERRYDLVAAADTLVYLGELATLFRAVSRMLEPAGHFLFTVERKDGEGFELGPERRWRHSETYLRTEVERARFDVAGFLECTPRTEAGVPVPGYAVALARLH